MKFETIDDKILFDNLNRFDAESIDTSHILKLHRKIYIISFVSFFALFLMTFSLAMFSYESPFVFFANHLSSQGFIAFLNIFYIFGIFFIFTFVLFILSFSSLYKKVILKLLVKKIYSGFKKINFTDFVYDLDFFDKYSDAFNNIIGINTFFKYDIPYNILLDNKCKRFVFCIADNLFSNVFNFDDIVSLIIKYNGKEFGRNDLTNDNGYFSLDEVFSFVDNELAFIHSCYDLSLVIKFKDDSTFPIIFVNEKLKRKKMLKNYSVIDNYKMIYNILNGYNWK